MDCPIERWCGDHWLHSDSVHLDDRADSGFLCVGESVHDHGSYEWHRLYVHGDGDERSRYWCRVDRIGCGDAVDGSRRTDVSFGHEQCEWSISCFLDRTEFQWWCGDHWLHSDFVHLDDRADSCVVCVGESVHDHGSYEWHRLYVHGDGDERSRYWCRVDRFCCSDAVGGSRCSDVSQRHQ